MEGVISSTRVGHSFCAPSCGLAKSGMKTSAQNLGARFSTLHGSAVVDSLACGRKSIDASVRSGGVGVKALWGMTATKQTTTSKQKTKLVKGRVVLSKKGILDLVDVTSDLMDATFELFNQKITLQLLSVDLDPSTQKPKVSEKAALNKWPLGGSGLTLVAGDEEMLVSFEVPEDFGEIGAFKISNAHMNEFYLHSLTLTIPHQPSVEFACNSWVFNVSKYSTDRVFFSNKVYLPADTPAGLKALRESELVVLRGDGKGERKVSDRIYDYDVYNDLGNPDAKPAVNRPPLGGSEALPYPRRIRTGRPKTKNDPQSESILGLLGGQNFIPPDEDFSRAKGSGFLAGGLKAIGHGIVPLLEQVFVNKKREFESFDDVRSIFKDGINVKDAVKAKPDVVKNQNPLVFIETIFTEHGEPDDSILQFPVPLLLASNEHAWLDDEEYGRQALSGLNPVAITLLKEFPPKSSLDNKKFGDATALTEAHIKPYLEGQTVAQAIKGKKLFTIDYHDAFMPYMTRINAGDVVRAYAPRTIFYHNNEKKLVPIAIELSLPPTSEGGNAINRVFTPPLTEKEDDYTWVLAKAHAVSADAGYHQVYSHFTRSHACVEPIIIATNRQLSRLHPIFAYLLPLFKSTMKINANARQVLINGGGMIEDFNPGLYTMQLGCVLYGAQWRFDKEALPADLIARGMAEPAEDGSEHSPGDVKLVIEDYPFAIDGLELWDAIKAYTTEYVKIAYADSDEAVQSDVELQSWWEEVVNEAHADKKYEAWWPKPDSMASLAQILTTIAWIAGPHHAAVNFGQYTYASFYPNHPTQTRRFIPEKGSKEYEELQANPQKFLLSSVSSPVVASKTMAMMELLSQHSVDEEYLGKRIDNNWTSDSKVQAAFAKFNADLRALETKQEERNKNHKLFHRSGPAKIPYTLLYPSSCSGLTGKGVPNSISI